MGNIEKFLDWCNETCFYLEISDDKPKVDQSQVNSLLEENERLKWALKEKWVNAIDVKPELIEQK